MANTLYEWGSTQTINHADLNNNIVLPFNGGADIGILTLFQQISAPGALVSAAASGSGNLTGVYQWKVTFITGLVSATGTLYEANETNAGNASVSLTLSSQNASLTSIPIGPTGTIARKIYRTQANGSTFYYDFEISDNTSTTWTDSTADSGLGSTTAPTTNSTGATLNLGPTTVIPSGGIINGSGSINVGGTGQFGGLLTASGGLSVASGHTFTNSGSWAGTAIPNSMLAGNLLSSLTATNGLSPSSPTGVGAGSYSLVLNGSTLSLGSGGLSLNLGNANSWDASQTFAAGLTISSGQTATLTGATIAGGPTFSAAPTMPSSSVPIIIPSQSATPTATAAGSLAIVNGLWYYYNGIVGAALNVGPPAIVAPVSVAV